MEWQPIETAPKDGTEILMYGENSVNIVTWTIIHWYPKRYGWGVSWSENDYTDTPPYEIKNPTHWMPLPIPPVNK